jgi:hypothetical protein
MLVTDYADFDVVFIHHMAGTMKNSITGQTIGQIGVLRGSKKTFFFDCGGYALSDLSCKVVTLQEAASALGSATFVSKAGTSPSVQPGEFDAI